MEHDFSENIVEQIEDNVQDLIQHLSVYEKGSEDFKKCCDFTIHHIFNEKYFPPPPIEIRKKIDVVILRYSREGFTIYSEVLRNSLDAYLESDDTNNIISESIKWKMLEVLLLLSDGVFKTNSLISLEDKLNECETVTLPDEFDDEEKINWVQYLQEGSEKYKLTSDDSETSRCDSGQSEEEYSMINGCILEPIHNDLFDQFPQPNVVIESENTLLKKALKDASDAKAWLMNNSQHSWWNDKPPTIPDSRHPAATFGIKWKHLINDESHHVQFWDEYKLIRELLWLFVGNNTVVSRRINFLMSTVSVPSLIQETTKSFIQYILNIAKKYCVLQSYCYDVFNNDVLQNTFSEQAYASVLKDYCRLLLLKVKEEDKIVQQQETTYTLLMLNNKMRSHLDVINFIHEVHISCVDLNRPREPSWIPTIRLLSQIYHKLKCTESHEHCKILLHIFFKTFEVYGDIIDLWLAEGKICDWKNEFFIKKNHRTNIYEAFPIEEVENRREVNIAPFFHRIARTLISCSQNVEFLSKLGKLHSTGEEIHKNGKLIDNLKNEFNKRLYQENVSSSVDCVKHELPENEFCVKKFIECDKDVSNSSYLLQAYRDVLEMINDGGKIDEQIRSGTRGKCEKDLKNLNSLPVSIALEQSLCSLIQRKELMIANLFKLSIVNDYKFCDHIKTLSQLLLMDLRSFSSRINTRLSKQIWEGDHIVIMFLYNCLESNKLPFGKSVYFSTDKENLYSRNYELPICIFEVIEIIDRISLQYKAIWPVCMIFTDAIQEFYDSLFKLLLKINVAFYSITRLSFKELPEANLWKMKFRRMVTLRYWVTLLLQKLRSYIMLTVSQCLDWKLIENVVEISTFNSLETSYSQYLEKIKYKCLMEPKNLDCFNRTLDRLWRVCDKVRNLWLKGKKLELTEQDISQSVQLYIHCLWYLTQILKNIAQIKNTNNPLYNLWVDLRNMIENHEKNIPEDLLFTSSYLTN